MNKNKIIFWIIWVILLIVLVYTIISINKKSSTWSNKAWKFNIWIIWDKVDSTEKIIANFKKLNTKYSNIDIKIEAFKNFDDYSYALTSSIFSGKSPDIFMLNNNEKDSIFSKQTIWINPESVNPSDFRKKYKGIFADDLISSSWSIEYLTWLPVWYETLWIFYNRRYVKDSELSSIAWLNNIVADLKDKYPDIIPIGIWNWSTVFWVADIITQFFMLDEWVLSLNDLVWKKSIQWLSSYFVYWDEGWYNGYDSKYIELNNLWQTGIDLFSKWETFMVVWYPSLINKIAEKGFSKNFLLASPFPHYSTNEWKTLVNYNYFVINKSSKEQNLANDFLAYLSTDVWVEDYLTYFPYYLPALLSLESDKLDQKINPNYNIVLSDFYNSDYELSSFNKWIKTLYDEGIISILDNPSNYDKSFLKFRENILCKAQKIITLENLSVVCE
jgi:hypothetical protein